MKISLLILFFFNMSFINGQSTDHEKYTIGEKHIIYSKILEEEREIYIYHPSGFWGMDEEISSYPLTVVLDGESLFQPIVSTIDFLSSAPLGNDWMPRSIVVGIPNTNRNRDLTPTKGIIGLDSMSLSITGGGILFLDFITEEIIPYVENLYSTNQHRSIIGHSMGGLIAFEALINKRDYFTNYLVIDPMLSYDNQSYFNSILDTLGKADLSEEKVYFSYTNTMPEFFTLKDIANDNSEILKLTKSNHRFANLASQKEWNIQMKVKYYPAESHFSIPHISSIDGLKYIYNYYPFNEIINYYHPLYKDRTDLVQRLKDHYRKISIQLGYQTIPMESYFYSWGYGLANFNRNDLAIDIFDYSIELYPTSPNSYNNKAYFLLNNDNDNELEAISLFQKSLNLQKQNDIEELLQELLNKEK